MNGVKLILGTMTFGESVFDSDVVEMIKCFSNYGYNELDTAYVYNDGKCETLIGEALKVLNIENLKISTKVNPKITGKLDGDAAYSQLNESLKRLGIPSVDTFYLHFPDPNTPVDSVLNACADMHRQGMFKELGLSNFPADLVAEVHEKCTMNNWVKPTVYEGVYNPLTRKAEYELNPVLNKYGIRFYAYNPLAGGLLTGKYMDFQESPREGRFTNRPNYMKRYWKESLFGATKLIMNVCEKHDIGIVEATYRWLAYDSMLNNDRGDAILVGASKLGHLEQNMNSLLAGPLPEDIIKSFSEAWEICKADSAQYFAFYGTLLS